MFGFIQVFFDSMKQDQDLFPSSLTAGMTVQTISPMLLQADFLTDFTVVAENTRMK